ncbi:hypothetical protein ACJ72_05033 [Emergomyces africanus]|uniref:Uncharacterized protein n=1 Tax=Emergomyces africanus TaxID=1955775 RepID=A0A1B7NVF3_9EURO|nr:hypothetical protein ACJ72_05033 [Emergomyces africanus]
MPSSESSDFEVPGGRHGETWTQEQDQRLLNLHKKHRHMNRHEFQEAFYPSRSHFAVSKRLTAVKQAEREVIDMPNIPIVGLSNRSQSGTSTSQYVYSEGEPENMPLDNKTDPEHIPGGRPSKQIVLSKRNDIPNSGLKDTLKRKPSAENDLYRKSPPKLPKTPMSPIFTSMNSGSNITPKADIPTISKANTVVNVGQNHDNHNNDKNTQVSNSSSPSAWIVQKTKAEDVLYLLEQAQKCDSETRRANNLAFQLSNQEKALSRSRDEIRQLLKLKDKQDGELDAARRAVLKEQNANKLLQKELNGARQLKPCEQCKTSKTAQLKMHTHLSELKTEVDKIRVGSSKIVHPNLWRSGGMEAASARVTKIIGEMEDPQNGGQK